jgi:predicted unusual protein kinase regulating ubiquinone biosynthesis (AarF/ABC1/UbiB family)
MHEPMHTLRIVLALLPFALSLWRDHRRWLWRGGPVPRSPGFHQQRAERPVARIASLGPTFVKLAQVFASRADLIPEPYLSRLGTLTDQVPSVPWDRIEATIREAYGKGPDELFERIDHTPVAAASLGQVHRALWRGRDVAVKVLRPHIEHTVARDVTAARSIAAWAARRWPIPHVQGFEALVEEFAARIAEEMDFRLEAEYATEVRANFAGNSRVIIPEIMHELTRRRVLVLAFVEGTRPDRLRPDGVDAQRLSSQVIEAYVQMMLVDGLFHADPHPGNLLVRADGALVLLDFGMMVRVPTEMRLKLIRTVFAAIRRDPLGVADGFTALGLVAPGADPAAIQRLSELLVQMAGSKSTTQQRLEVMLAERVMKSLYDFPVILPRDLVYFARTAALIEGIGTKYDPYFNAVQVGTPVVMRMRSRILTSLGEEAQPSVEELAAVAGWAAGRAWRGAREWLDRMAHATAGSRAT